MIKELCHSWNPIPEKFSTNWQVDVVRFQQTRGPEAYTRVSIFIAAYWEIDVAEDTHDRESGIDNTREEGAWQISFNKPVMFQKRDFYDISPSLVMPNFQAAFWEIQPSKWIMEMSPPSPGAIVTDTLHHYVIRSAIREVYEIVATGWASKPLEETWAKPFGYPVP